MAKQVKALNKKQVIGAAAIIGALVIGFVFLKYIGMIRELDLKIASQTAILEKPSAKGKGGIAKDEIDTLKEDIKLIKKQYEMLASTVESTPLKFDPDVVASEGDELYFKQKVYELVQRLKRQNLEKRMTLQESLGFGEGIPPRDMVAPMLRQVKLVEGLIVILLEEGASNIQAVKPQPVIAKKSAISASKVIYKEIPVRAAFTCDMETLVNVLYRLESESPVYLVRELDVKPPAGTLAQPLDKGALKTDMLVSVLALE